MKVKPSAITTVFIVLFVPLFAGCAYQYAKKNETAKTLLIPLGFESAYENIQYSAAVKLGNILFVSGVAGGEVGETLEDKVRKAFLTIKRILEYAGSGLDDVVEIVTYHRNMADFYRFNAIKLEFFKSNYPAWTAVGTTGLVNPDAEVEIKVTAVIGSGKNVRFQREWEATNE
ncbi:MAG: RidA family protein [Deltaproteobacteria bacterium]|jgi:enamine deaminase RidA (YjgF/YER057c/UK114 family)|nr:RidA family protein [Deltaproteobacteria bacterium]